MIVNRAERARDLFALSMGASAISFAAATTLPFTGTALPLSTLGLILLDRAYSQGKVLYEMAQLVNSLVEIGQRPCKGRCCWEIVHNASSRAQ